MNTGTSTMYAIKSELLKLWIPAIRNTAIIGLVAYLLLIFVAANPNNYGDLPTGVRIFSYQFVTQSWSLLILFAAVVGTLAVTAEYSHNTMRSTLLAIPNRFKAAGAKFIAVALCALGYFAIIFSCSALLAKIRLGSAMAYRRGDLSAISVALIILIATTLLSTAFGYLLRSTAGSMAMIIFLFYILGIVQLIPRKFFMETLPHWLPMSLANRAMEVGKYGDGGDLLGPVTDPYFSSPWLALAIYCGYLLVAVIAALVVYRKRDA